MSELDDYQGDPSAERVVIELTPSQVDRVVREASGGGNLSLLLSGLGDARAIIEAEPDQLHDGRLSRSLLSGLLMLAALPEDGGYTRNAELARTLNLNPSTAHRYLSTFVAVGLVERDPATRRYRLAFGSSQGAGH